MKSPFSRLTYKGVASRGTYHRTLKQALGFWWRIDFVEEFLLKRRWYPDKQGNITISDTRYSRFCNKYFKK